MEIEYFRNFTTEKEELEIMSDESRLILGLDGLGLFEAVKLAEMTADRICAVKIHNLYDEYGPSTVAALKKVGVERVWVDAKLHDIPGTVKARATAIASSGAHIVTIHASGGVAMMQAAKEVSDLEIFAVTVLTSLDGQDLQLLFGSDDSVQLVENMVEAIMKTAVDGIVCSALEVTTVKATLGDRKTKLIVPGTRSLGKSMGDQKRSSTPAEAIQAGATHLVIASQVTGSKDPLGELSRIEDEIVLAQGRQQ